MILCNLQGFLFTLTIIHFLTISFLCSVSARVHNHGPLETLYNNFTTYRFGQNYKGLSNIKSYFHHFGYIPNGPPFNDNFDDTLVFAVQTYQKNYHLKVTGELDHETLRHIMIPRCGVPDIIKQNTTKTYFNEHSHDTISLYSFFKGMPRWPPGTTQLTYAFSPELTLSDSFRSAFASAFNKWTPVVRISFQETKPYQTANIKIGFYKGDHGDGLPFDGPGGIWAHSFAPTVGLFHLDGDEYWVTDVTRSTQSNAVDLESVAVHEIGHLLGLGHSMDTRAIMYPYLPSNTRKVELSKDDIQGIQQLYVI